MSDQRRYRVRRLDPGDVIPDDWTAEEANMVFDFLLLVTTAIFDKYEEEMTYPIRDRGDSLNEHDDQNVIDADDPFDDSTIPF